MKRLFPFFGILGLVLSVLIAPVGHLSVAKADTPTCYQGNYGLSCQNYDGTQLCSSLGVPCNNAPNTGTCASSYSVICKSPGTTSSSSGATCTPTFTNLCLGENNQFTSSGSSSSSGGFGSSGLGGSQNSGGNSSAGSVFIPVPIKPSCTSAPDAPLLTISHPSEDSGPLFHFKIAPTGQPAVNMSFSYTLYDSTSKTWGSWKEYSLITSITGLLGTDYQAQLQDGVSRIAFSVFATNSCGSSPQARESTSNTGILLTSEKTLKDWLATSGQKEFNDLNTALEKSKSTYPLSVSDLTKVQLQAPLIPTLTGDPDIDAPKVLNFGNLIGTWANSVSAEIDNAALVRDAADKAAADKAAADALAAQQAAQANAAAARKTTITCMRGKLAKTVTAVKPACPGGYKKK